MNLGSIYDKLSTEDIEFITKSILPKNTKYFVMVNNKERHKYPFIPLKIVEQAMTFQINWNSNISNDSHDDVIIRSAFDLARAERILKCIKAVRKQIWYSNYTTMPG